MMDMKQKPVSPATMLSDAADDGAYPEGLCIELDNETLKRLGIGGGNLPQVGQRVMVCAIGEVVEVCKEDGMLDKGYCVEIQLQQLELNPPEEMNEQQSAHEQIGRLYG